MNNKYSPFVCETHNLKSLIKQPTYYENPNSPTCIDLVLTNVPRTYQSTCIIETGLSNYHLTTLTVMRKFFKKIRPRIINYRCFKQFSNKAFREILTNNLSSEEFVHNDKGLHRFCKVYIENVNNFAPIKRKYTRGNQMCFMTKELFKEITTRSRLRNNFLKNRTEGNTIRYTKQRNKCASLRRAKKKYYGNVWKII